MDDIFRKACLNGIYYKESGIIDSWGIDDDDEMILVAFGLLYLLICLVVIIVDKEKEKINGNQGN